MKIAILYFAFFLAIANAEEWRNDLTETEIDSKTNSSEILNEGHLEYIWNNNDVEYINEEENEDFFKNGNERADDVDVDRADAVGLSESEINARNNYEGDEMIISEESKKRGVGSSEKLWPRIYNGKLKIPYYIDSSNMNHYMEGCNSDLSNVWVKRYYQSYYIRFQNSTGCSSYVGYQKIPKQPINLAPACIRSATVLHEMLHAMGFSHEQSRSDKDRYVKINYGNIQTGRQRNFYMLRSMIRGSLRTPYDYGSVMHYPKRAFSKNGGETIVPQNSNAQIGQRVEMSKIDIEEVSNVYKCDLLVKNETLKSNRLHNDNETNIASALLYVNRLHQKFSAHHITRK